MDNQPSYNVTIRELKSMYSSLKGRTRKRISRMFTEYYQLNDDNTVFCRLMDGRIDFCFDEYLYIVPIITAHYEFEKKVKEWDAVS